MGLFTRRQQQPNQPPPPSSPAPPAPIDFNAAMQIFAVDAVKAQTEFASMQHQHVKELVELNAEITRNLVRTGGKRLGGKVRAKTAKRDAHGRMIAECRLCHNSGILDPTVDEIKRHATHAAPRPPVESPMEPIPVQIQTDPRTGDEVIECEACGKPHAEGEHVN